MESNEPINITGPMKVVRWILFIPAGLFLGGLIGGLSELFFSFLLKLLSVDTDIQISMYLASIVIGYAVINFGVRVSPAFLQLRPALILGAIVFIGTTVGIFEYALMSDWANIIDAVCVQLGLFLGIYHAKINGI